jgi:IclR family transcriptional regulator, KDG regulon repressor
VLLAYQPPEYVKQVLSNGLKACTPKTITRRDDMLAVLEEVASREYAIDDEESEPGLRAIAAPVRNHTGQVIAALGVAAPLQRMTKKVLQDCVPSVVATAAAVSQRLGYEPRRGPVE